MPLIRPDATVYMAPKVDRTRGRVKQKTTERDLRPDPESGRVDRQASRAHRSDHLRDERTGEYAAETARR